MRLIPARKIVEGVELARDVVTGPPGSAPLLRTGVRLSARYATLLPKAGIDAVWIEDDLGEYIDVEEPLTAETRVKVHRVTGETIEAARRVPDGGRRPAAERARGARGRRVDARRGPARRARRRRSRSTTCRRSTATRTATASR